MCFDFLYFFLISRSTGKRARYDKKKYIGLRVVLNFMKIRLVAAEVFHVDGRTDGRTDEQTGITILTVVFRNSANALIKLPG
jgi:hypothetical protein